MAHGLMYAVFAFSCLWGYREQLVANGPAYRKKAILITIAIGIAYGGLTEIIQATLVPSRTGDWFDFVADIVGTCLGTYVFHLLKKKKK